MGEAVTAPGVHGFPAMRTSFVGRAVPVRELASLVERCPLVTLTGPGGSGKTRLACEVARRVAGRFADGVWLVELAPVREPGQVPAAVAAALGVREQPGVPVAGTLARVLARQQLLVVLDNCEHVLGAAAELCAGLLAACDDLRVLATSREPLRVADEAGYRLGPLAVPDPGDLACAAACEAVVLFADRAGRADAHFTLDGETTPAVARLVARLDGMPLAIELAAARAEALGVAGLLDRLEDRFALLAGGDRLAPPRQRSLAAAVEWSYQLLDEHERRVFRAVSVFPGPFTLEGAEAVSGTGAGPAVLHLVDCSLLVPPRAGPDGRSRYGMLETLRAYGARLLAGAVEQDTVAAALAGHALRVAEQASAELQTSAGELAAARWLDAEDPTMRQVLAWATEHDPGTALRLAVALAWWWLLRDRLAGQYLLLQEVTSRAETGNDQWRAAQFWLGRAAVLAGDLAGALSHYTGLRDAAGDEGPCPALADALAGRAHALINMGHYAEAADEARRAVAAAEDIGYPAAEVLALTVLSYTASITGDHDRAVQLARRAGRISASVPGPLARMCSWVLTEVLAEAGDLDGAEAVCVAGLARARDIGDLGNLAPLLHLMAVLDVRAGRPEQAAAHLQEALQIDLRGADPGHLLSVMDCCGNLCAATGRYAEAITLWAAIAAWNQYMGFADGALDIARRAPHVRQARQALGPEQARAAEDRGAAMSVDTAAEYALMLTAPASALSAAAAPGPGQLSARERELVTLVAQGATDAQIAGQLYISIRTVRSHLDRIRDKTGCRRRADLTRLALQAGLV